MRRPRAWGGALLAAALAGSLVLATGALAAANLLRDSSFESPVLVAPSQTFTAGQSIHKCIAGTARNCWLVTTGSVDLTGALWQAKAGAQTVELEGGATKGEIVQSFSTVPGTNYRVTFFLSSDPAAPDNVGVRVSWEDIDGHGDTTGLVQQDFTYFNPTHTAINMKYQKHSFVVAGTDVEGRLFFTNTSGLPDPGTGPVLDKLSIKPV